MALVQAARTERIVIQNVKLLGTFEVETESGSSAIVKSAQGSALLAYLLVTQQTHAREAIAALLWDGPSTADTLRYLRKLLYRLRPLLPRLQVTRHQVAYPVEDGISVDLYQLEAALADVDVAQLDRALRLYRGELLAGFYLDEATGFSEWLALERERLRLRVSDGFHRVCVAYEAEKSWQKGIEAARRWLTLDEFDEEIHCQLLRLLAADGQVMAAREHYEHLRQRLWDELEVEPAPSTVELHEQIQAADRSPRGLSVHLPPTSNRQHWGEAPSISAFFGRETKIAQLAQWFSDDAVHLIIILGLGGQGKTALAAKVARREANQFASVYRRSLINAPPLEMILYDYLNFLSHNQFAIPADRATTIAEIQRHLGRERHLLILDNLETILEPENAGHWRSGYAGYAEVLQLFGQGGHRSTLLVTSREAPLLLNRLERQVGYVVTLRLPGLVADESSGILALKQIAASREMVTTLTQRYSGNPLALHLAVQTIEEFYFGNVEAFLNDETLIFEDIRDVLDIQFERLSPMEREILLWLAITREATDPLALADRMVSFVSRVQLLDAVRNLQRRSLLVREPRGFALQNVVMEYLTDYLVKAAVAELLNRLPNLLHRHPLMQAQVKEYVRQSQVGVILQPVATQLVDQLGRDGIGIHMQMVLDELRQQVGRDASYVAGTVFNLLLYLDIDLGGFDFSNLAIRQVDMRNHSLSNVNITGAVLSNCAFTQTFTRVEAVAVSPNGRWRAAGGDGGEVRVYELANHQPRCVLSGHTNTVTSLTFSPNSELLASASHDGSVRLWNLESEQQAHVLNGQGPLLTVAFSPNGGVVVSAGHDPMVRIWDVRLGVERFTFPSGTHNVREIAFHPKRELLAVSSYEGYIHLWDIQSIQRKFVRDSSEAQLPTQVLTADKGVPIQSLAFSSDGKLLISGANDGTITLWDTASRKSLCSFRGHRLEVRSLIFGVDNRLFYSGGSGPSPLRIWDATSCDLMNSMFQEDTTWSLARTPDGKTLISGREDGTIHLWDVSEPASVSLTHTYYGYRREYRGVDWSPCGRWLAAGDIHGVVHVWDVRGATPERHYTLLTENTVVDTVAFSPDSQMLATTSGFAPQSSVQIWDMESGIRHHMWSLKTEQLSVAFAHGGKTLISSGNDSTLRMWDLANPHEAPLRQIIDPQNGRLGMSCFREGNLMTTYGGGRAVCCWQLAASTKIATLMRCVSGHGENSFAAIDPGANLLACSAPGDSIALWNLNDAEASSPLHTLVGHTNRVQSAAFSPDGALLVSCGYDRSVRLWDVGTGQQRAHLGNHPQFVGGVTFSPDGTKVASIGKEGSLRIWDVTSGELAHVLQAPGPYQGMNITGVSGISEVQKGKLRALGAVEFLD